MGVRELGIRKAILDTVEARLRVDEAAQKKEKELEKPIVRYCNITFSNYLVIARCFF